MSGKTRMKALLLASALGALAACGKAPPATGASSAPSSSAQPSPAQSSPADTASASGGASAKDSKPTEEKVPAQGQVDARQPEQQRQFQSEPK